MKPNSKCVLMFSGGRDSTIAAIRLARECDQLCLVTVTTDHLHGIQEVHRRLDELSHLLPAGSEWRHVIQDETSSSKVLKAPGGDTPKTVPIYDSETCLPCHRDYTSIGVSIALSLGAKSLAFGYAGYQSTWPEQTLEATNMLREILRSVDLQLLLPAYDVSSKENAISELLAKGLTTESLEQKCLHQRTSEELPKEKLIFELARWETALRKGIDDSKDRKVKFFDLRKLGGKKGKYASG